MSGLPFMEIVKICFENTQQILQSVINEKGAIILHWFCGVGSTPSNNSPFAMSEALP